MGCVARECSHHFSHNFSHKFQSQVGFQLLFQLLKKNRKNVKVKTTEGGGGGFRGERLR